MNIQKLSILGTTLVQAGVRNACTSRMLVLFALLALFLPLTLMAQEEEEEEDYELVMETVIVTGTIIRNAAVDTASPVTVLTSLEMDLRGINTIADAVTMLPANNAGTMNASWSTFGFASGASAVSLRGLTTSSTLTIFDGMRMAPYPLGDDGRRNFVDLGTIPDSIVERIEVLKDGASSTYGADAIAGVVNVITKKEITGLHLNSSYGVSQEGDGDEIRGDITWGFGSLNDDGFNFYVNVEVQESDPISWSDRDWPGVTWDYTDICKSDGVCMDNFNNNGVQPDGTIFGVSSTGTRGVAMVRPRDAITGATAGNWQLLNPSAGCRGFKEVNPTNAADVGLTGPACEYFYYEDANIYPNIERNGLNFRFTKRLGDSAEAYVMFNYYNVNTSESGGSPRSHRSTTTPGGVSPFPGDADSPTVGMSNTLPVYICPLGTGAELYPTCDASNGVLNPNNPFAADGQTAQVSMRFPFSISSDTDSESFRYAAGVTGSFEEWDYDVNVVSAKVKLDVLRTGYPIPRNVNNVIYDGSFNYVDPSQNSQQLYDYIAPPKLTYNTSEVNQFQATLARSLFELPGGTLVAAIGVAYRDEKVNAPSANPFNVDPYSRYVSMNTVAAVGDRDVKSGFFEISVPVSDMLNVNLAGRYDDYSTGQGNFSPKVGIQFTPTEQIKLRGTYSEGFRIPSFNEAFGAPTTGYITHSLNVNNPDHVAFAAAHGNNAYVTGGYSLGLTASGNSSLEPEESEAFTIGFVFQPSRNISVTLDYWRIKVNNLISNADYAPAIEQYYANNGVVDLPGITVIPAAPDPEFPNALPLLGFIQYSYENVNSEIASGVDLGATISHDFGNVHFTTHLELSYLEELSKTIDGVKDNYAGTLSPCDVTSCSGAPDWRATWVNSINWNDLTVALTANFTGSYDNASVDYGGVPGDCENNVGVSVYYYSDGSPYKCTHKEYLDFDFSATYRFNEKMELYVNIVNVFDKLPDFDPSAAYGLYGFNPAWELSGWRGRYFRFGVRLDY